MEAAVGAYFEALDEGVLVAASKSTGYFFPISISPEVLWISLNTRSQENSGKSPKIPTFGTVRRCPRRRPTGTLGLWRLAPPSPTSPCNPPTPNTLLRTSSSLKIQNMIITKFSNQFHAEI